MIFISGEIIETEEQQLSKLFEDNLGDIVDEKKLQFEFDMSDEHSKPPIIPKDRITLVAGVDEIIELSNILSLRSKNSIFNPQVVKITDKKNFAVSCTNSVMYHTAYAKMTEKHNVLEGVGDLVIDWNVFVDKLEKRIGTLNHVAMSFVPQEMKWLCVRKNTKTSTTIISPPYDTRVTWKDKEFKEIKDGTNIIFEAYNEQLVNWIKVQAKVLTSIISICESFEVPYLPLILNSNGELDISLSGKTEITKGEDYKDSVQIKEFHIESDRIESYYIGGIKEYLACIPSEEVMTIYFADKSPMIAVLDGKRKGIRFNSKTLIQAYSLT